MFKAEYFSPSENRWKSSQYSGSAKLEDLYKQLTDRIQREVVNQKYQYRIVDDSNRVVWGPVTFAEGWLPLVPPVPSPSRRRRYRSPVR